MGIPSRFLFTKTLLNLFLTLWKRGWCEEQISFGVFRKKNCDYRAWAIKDIFSYTCRNATQLACHAVEKNEGYELFNKIIEEVSEHIYILNIETETHFDASLKEIVICNEESSQFVQSDPNVSITNERRMRNV